MNITFGRKINFDERSREYPIRACVGAVKPRSRRWRLDTLLNQGREGSCVGHGIAHELLATPAAADPAVVTHSYATQKIYWGAQKIDPWPGGDYPLAFPRYEGTDVLSGLKTAVALGWCDEYRWSFSLNDLVLGIGYNGPAVLGLVWTDGMMLPDVHGVIEPTGKTAGGHCVCAAGVDLADEYFWIAQSWGRDHGVNGWVKIRFDAMEKLLKNDGEAAFFLRRHKQPRTTT